MKRHRSVRSVRLREHPLLQRSLLALPAGGPAHAPPTNQTAARLPLTAGTEKMQTQPLP